MAQEMITIDGSRGEGGGQILRTSMACAAITGVPLRLINIRAKRSKPGLMRQHLTAVRAVCEVSGGTLRGDELGASTLEFQPGTPQSGDYEFAVGTAGSAALVLQSVLPVFFACDLRGSVAVEGGTHAKAAPPYHFLAETYGEALRMQGREVAFELARYGFFPAGGGRIVAEIGPSGPPVPLELVEPTEFAHLEVVVLNSGLDEQVAHRELDVVRSALADEGIELSTNVESVTARSRGNVLFARLRGGPLTAVITAFGERRKRAEQVAEELVTEIRKLLDARVAVGEHLADQLLVLASLGAGGRFRTTPLSLHSRTMVELLPRFLDVSIDVEPDEESVWVEVSV